MFVPIARRINFENFHSFNQDFFHVLQTIVNICSVWAEPVFHPPAIYEVICAWMVIDIRASMNHSRSISDSTSCSHLRHRHAITPFQNRPKRRHVFSSAISCSLNVPRFRFKLFCVCIKHRINVNKQVELHAELSKARIVQ